MYINFFRFFLYVVHFVKNIKRLPSQQVGGTVIKNLITTFSKPIGWSISKHEHLQF